jgi:hypothetical protein
MAVYRLYQLGEPIKHFSRSSFFGFLNSMMSGIMSNEKRISAHLTPEVNKVPSRLPEIRKLSPAES